VYGSSTRFWLRREVAAALEAPRASRQHADRVGAGRFFGSDHTDSGRRSPAGQPRSPRRYRDRLRPMELHNVEAPNASDVAAARELIKALEASPVPNSNGEAWGGCSARTICPHDQRVGVEPEAVSVPASARRRRCAARCISRGWSSAIYRGRITTRRPALVPAQAHAARRPRTGVAAERHLGFQTIRGRCAWRELARELIALLRT